MPTTHRRRWAVGRTVPSAVAGGKDGGKDDGKEDEKDGGIFPSDGGNFLTVEDNKILFFKSQYKCYNTSSTELSSRKSLTTVGIKYRRRWVVLVGIVQNCPDLLEQIVCYTDIIRICISN